MTRKQLIHLLVLQARSNGFEFRKWFREKIGGEWTTSESAIETLSQGHRYYALLFSHQFARHFWKTGMQMQFMVPAQTYKRLDRNGKEVTVIRKAFTRRTMRGNVWEYHLREMAAAEEPLRYIHRFLVTTEALRDQPEPSDYED